MKGKDMTHDGRNLGELIDELIKRLDVLEELVSTMGDNLADLENKVDDVHDIAKSTDSDVREHENRLEDLEAKVDDLT